MDSTEKIFQIERPSENLMKLYLIRSILSGPLIVVTFPLLFIRYYTLRYRFDSEGILMRWGFLFRKEISLTYSRIQDIHVSSGIIQRWLGLADLKIQTASGNMEPEMTIEGIKEYEILRDFIYGRMRGLRKSASTAAVPETSTETSSPETDLAVVVAEIRNELSAARMAIEKMLSDNGDHNV